MFNSYNSNTAFFIVKQTASFILAVFLFYLFGVHAFAQTPDSSKEMGVFGSVNESDGSLNYTYPIVVPPGRNNFQPNLSLTYTSNGNREDIFGRGWSINIPYIQRLNKTGIDKLYNANFFFSSIDGEIVSLGGGVYVPRVNSGSKNTYTFVNNKWSMFDKFGTEYTFGSTTASRQDNVASSTQIYKWMLNEGKDTNGNTIEYSYFKDRGEIYPNEISYNQEDLFSVIFNRTSRSTASSSYPGFSVYSGYEINNIQIEADGSLVNEYDLTKTSNYIEEIVRTGHANSNPTEVSPVELTYASEGQSNTWSYESVWDTTLYNAFSPGTKFVDINGDALPDAVTSYWDTSWGPDHQRGIMINDGSGWSQNDNGGFSIPEDYDFVFYDDDAGRPGNAQLADINGDLLPDFVIFDNQGGGVAIIKAYVNTGSSWVYDARWNFTTYTDFSPGTRFADVNGDGLAEILISYWDTSWGPDHQAYVYLNTGSGWSLSGGGFSIPEDHDFAFWDENDGRPGLGQLGDINGDGLVDLIKFTNGSPDEFQSYINSGSGWQYDSRWDRFMDPTFGPGSQFTDINGDGLPDFVMTWVDGGNFQESSFVNTGYGWVDGFSIPDDDLIAIWNEGAQSPGKGHLSDVNGDGLTDFISMGSDDEIKVYLNTANPKTLISEIKNSYGGVSAYTYTTPGIQHVSNKGRVPLNIVETEVTDNLYGVVSTTTYSYRDANYWFASSTDKRFASFGTATATDSWGKRVTKFHQANGTTTDEESDSSYAQIGQPYTQTVFDLNGGKYRSDHITYLINGTSTGTSSILRGRVLTRAYDGDTLSVDSGIEYTYDIYGNVSSTVEYGKVNGQANGSFSDLGTDKRTTLYTYATSSAEHIYGLLATEQLNDYSGNKVREKKLYYDSQSLGVATNSNLTKIENWIADSTYASTTRIYNGYGLVTQESDPRGKVTTYIYDSHNLYPATTTNALSQSIKNEYNYAIGKIATATDANGYANVSVYDGLGRVVEQKIPHPQSGTLVRNVRNIYTDTQDAVSVLSERYLNTASSTHIYNYLDGFGRNIQERGSTENGTQHTVRDFIFRNDGLLTDESLPYFNSGTSRTAPTTDSDLYTEYAYDPLGRLISATTTVGNTYTSYDQWVQTITDVLGNNKILSYDAYQRLGTTTEELSTTTYSTVYAWDNNNKLVSLQDADGNIRNFTYDGLGRRKSAQDLHDTNDTGYGVWYYDYDATGNTSSSSDPNGQVINYTYDSLNRVLTEDYLGSAGTEVSYVYDTCTNGKGRLCQSVNNSATATNAYTPNGFLSTTTKVISGSTQVYTTVIEPDWQGNKTVIKYPDNAQVSYSYNNGGRVEKIQYREPGGAWSDILSDIDYGPHGMVIYQLHGNNAETEKTYDEDELYRLRTIVTTVVPPTGGPGDELRLLEEELFGSDTDTNTSVEFLETEFFPTTTISEVLVIDATSTETVPEIITEEVSSSTVEQTEEIISTTIPTDFSLNQTVPTTTQEILPISVDVSTLLVGKDARERANIKAGELAKVALPDRLSVPQYNVDIKIHKIDPIEGGIQVYAQAWKNDSQLGFGKDGSVDIERFLVYNPPLLVADEKGEIVREIDMGLRGEKDIREFRYRLDPDEALKQIIGKAAATIGWKDSDIEAGKVGNTTSVFYSEGHPETTVVDGYLEHSTAAAGVSWASLVSAAGTTFNDNDGGSLFPVNFWAGTTAGQWRQNLRVIILFDTSSIGSDVVSSTTLSLFGISLDNANGLNPDFNVYTASPTSNTSLAASDYATIGSEPYLDTSFPVGSWNTSGYNVLTFNSAGTEAVNTNGITRLGLKNANYDAANVAPTWTSNANPYIRAWTTDWTGTTQDPVLIVTHEAPQSPANSDIVLHLSYAYDSVGNMTSIVDQSNGTSSIATTTYTYDDLYRLKTASTTGTSTTPYSYTYSYDALGNITSSNVGTYTYAETNFANPHAPTTINGITYRYDRNGNTASTSAGHLNTWDYRSRLNASQGGGTATTTYLYDVDDSRIRKVSGATTTYYVGELYEKNVGTTTKNIYLDDMLVASIEGRGTATTTNHIHSDHLGSTRLVSNPFTEVVQRTDYYPYGAKRSETGTSSVNHEYIGQEYDEESSMSYLNARYYKNDRGQFISQDPVFLGIGSDPRTAQALKDPQLLNSYSYARNNPIVYKDPNGEWVHIAAGALIGGGVGLAGQGFQDAVNGNFSGYEAYAGAAAGGATFGAVTAATGGLSLVGAGVVGVGSGVVQSGVEQGLNIAGGNQTGFDAGAAGTQALSNGVTSLIPGLKVAPVSVGRGSFEAIQKQIYTKLGNGTISVTGLQPSTVGKIFTAGFAQQLPGVAVQSTYSSLVRQLQQLQQQVDRLKQKLSDKKEN
jgi:RHS repeat-associated protein